MKHYGLKINNINTLLKGKGGFTLVELLIVLALMVIVLDPIYNTYFVAQSTYARIDAEAKVIQETNLFLTNLRSDIYSAQIPNDTTAAISSLSTDSINIYHVDTVHNEYELIQYRLLNGVLQRGSAKSSYPLTGSPSTPGSWQTVISGVNNADIFTAESIVDMGDRCKVTLNLNISGSPPISSPFELNTVLISRSQGEDEE